MKEYQKIALKELANRKDYLNRKLADDLKKFQSSELILLRIDESLESYQKDLAEMLELMNQEIKILSQLESILLNQEISETVPLTFNMIATIVRRMPIKNREKLNIFFDFIEKEVNLVSENTLALGLEFKDFLESNGIATKEFREICDQHDFALFNFFVRHKWNIDPIRLLKELDKNNEATKNIKRMYFILNKYYFEVNRIPSVIGLQKISEALTKLNLEKKHLDFIMSELEKVVSINAAKEQRKQRNYQSTTKLFEKAEFIQPISNQEWKTLNEEIRKRYDVKSDLAVKSLNMIEKIKLITLLQKLSYNEDPIKRILWNIDTYKRMDDYTNAENTLENALIIKRMIQKEEQKLNHIKELEEMKEIEKMLEECEESEKEIWLDLLLELIEEENQKQLQVIIKINQELHTIPMTQKATWREVFYENNNIEAHNAYSLLNIILKYVHKLPKENQSKWKEQARIALYRMYLENIGNYTYEIEEAKKLGESTRKRVQE